MWSNLMPKFVVALLEMTKSIKQTYMTELLSVALFFLKMKKKLSLGTNVSSEFLKVIQEFSNSKCNKDCKKVLREIKNLLGM